MKLALAFTSLSLLVLVAFPLYTLGLSQLVGSSEERAAFGEMFGGLSALFSALAFVAVAFSIFLQAKELKQQQTEGRQTQAGVEETARILQRTATLNALSILARTYSDTLDWIDEQAKQGIDKSGPKVAVSNLHRDVIADIERLSGREQSLYDE